MTAPETSHDQTDPQLKTLEESDVALHVAWAIMHPGVKGFAIRITANADHQEDLIEEAWIKLWRLGPSRYRLTEETERFYLRRVLRNHMIDHWGSKPASLDKPGATTHAEREAYRQECIAELRAEVDADGLTWRAQPD